ncbi:nonribosomal peptide synthetase MxaA [Methylobrevis albus]|uniref:Nonribosomal peptide synthetase MxaA n=1 Tax=Methylobrevis albus TaxID=2793297 RepID=A0A931I170_9HYPH|nr:nonribosomal peptide synthetase MxaA [Methylobrevis albus]MBH0237882.1 nonribosomal peptide synthetase MxaA [Methylobrevis albus]
MRAVGTGLLLLLTGVAPAAAAEPRVVLEPPRGHGWWMGDQLGARVRIEVDAGLAVDTAALPRPRPIDYWLDLVAVVVEPAGDAGPGRTAFDLRLTYQTFYAPLEPKQLVVPAATVGFSGPDGPVTVTVPAWRFVTAPLREIMAPTVPAAMRPNVPLALADTRPLQVGTLAAAALALLSVTGLAHHRAWWPFRRRDRPFAAAAGVIARLPADTGGAGLKPGFAALHRAFDASFGRRMLGEDIGDFLARRPAFRGALVETAAFFTASRQLFFSRGDAGLDFDRARLAGLAKRLAAIERGGAA